ncbi:hypothetical protein GTQ34_14415 [Muricauda sp. JGD-17]|uniref:Uncharacterized protein n=1 Tax=Flagellimonas ochracea TaxID=2696472 RepID=A0A964TF94_9FLAO|nr:hypothetical protein [Allomuricauda ochracea]NAY93108.1 hypothetical protein [Allomuricauda ochracea]
MKNLKKYIYLLTLSILFFSCSSEEKLVEEVLATTPNGVVLRTISVNSSTFDFFDPAKEWSVTLEVQDAENGELLSEIDIYMTFINDGIGENETLVKTVSASTFSTGPFGLPRGDISISLSEALNALGLQNGDYDSADSFNIRLAAKLTDGREFTNRAAGTVLNGSFFNSPFAYSAQFFCELADASLFDGNYTVVEDVWVDYVPGDVVPVQFVSNFTFRILSTNNPFIANTGTSYMEVTIDPSTGSATMKVNEPFDYGIPIDVIGVGSVGTCTGSITLNLEFVGFATNQTFILVKN